MFRCFSFLNLCLRAQGVEIVTKDTDGECFPWTPKPLYDLSTLEPEILGEMNDTVPPEPTPPKPQVSRLYEHALNPAPSPNPSL